MPVPASAVLKGPFFKQLGRRECEISFFIEGDDGGEDSVTLVFEGVEAYKTTYLTSLGSVDRDLRREAYGDLIAVEGSDWLAQMTKAHAEYCASAQKAPNKLNHLMICFDDGPCYEVVCVSFRQVNGGQI